MSIVIAAWNRAIHYPAVLTAIYQEKQVLMHCIDDIDDTQEYDPKLNGFNKLPSPIVYKRKETRISFTSAEVTMNQVNAHQNKCFHCIFQASGVISEPSTHWGRDKMAAVAQTTLSNAFSWMKISEFRLRFHWSLFLREQLTIIQHWFR